MVTSKEPEAFVFSMLTAQDDSQLPFLLSRYISIFAYDSEEYGPALAFNNNFEDFYFWKCGKLSLFPAHLPNYAVYPGLMVKLAKAMLDEGRYILGLWNEQYIEGTMSYKREYHAADFILYGYSEDQFYSFRWQGGMLIPFTVSYGALESALYLEEPAMNMIWGAALGNGELEFELDNVKNALCQFIRGDVLNDCGCAFGYKSIEYLAQQFGSRQYSNRDYRELICLWEYTRLMTLRIEYMRKMGIHITEQVLTKTHDIEKKAFDLKYNRMEIKLDSLIECIFEIADQERDLACELLSVLGS